MNKVEAATTLGVSVRALERFASAGRLPSRYVRGKTGQVLDFEPADVERFKTELEAPQERGHVVPDGEARQAPSKTLAMVGAPSRAAGFTMVDLANFAAAVAAHQRPSVEVRDKLTLSIAEAGALSGYGPTAIKRALAEGTLKGRKAGRGVRITRKELEAFIETI